MPPCRFLTKKRYSVPHQSSQLTEDTEVGGEKRKDREDGKGKQGRKDVWSDTESKREVKEIQDLNNRKEMDRHGRGSGQTLSHESTVLKEGNMV